MLGRATGIAVVLALTITTASAVCPYDVNCLNNPYGGRDESAPAITVAPYGAGQLGGAFAANPLRHGSLNDPYAPQASNAEAPVKKGRTSGSSASPGSLEGVDPDARN